MIKMVDPSVGVLLFVQDAQAERFEKAGYKRHEEPKEAPKAVKKPVSRAKKAE